MYMKKYDTDGHFIVAVCDEDIIGKKFREGELVLKVDECFYKGGEADEEEVKEALCCATMVNISGEKSIACADLVKDSADLLYCSARSMAEFVAFLILFTYS